MPFNKTEMKFETNTQKHMIYNAGTIVHRVHRPCKSTLSLPTRPYRHKDGGGLAMRRCRSASIQEASWHP